MKSRVFLVLIAVVIVVHALLFFVPNWQRDREEAPAAPETETPTTVKVEEPPATPPVAPAARKAEPSPASNGEPDPEDGTDSGERAADLVKRADASTPRPPPSKPLSPTVDPSETETPLEVGLVEGASKLSPEIRELAREGAEAVAAQRWDRAREIYLEMIDKAPDNALAYANLGVAEYELGNLLAASGNLRKSLELNPSIARNWQTLGLIHYQRGEMEMAISCLTRAIHEDPSEARSRLYLAAVVRDYGWLEAAITELQRAVETDPELADAHYNLAITYLDQDPPRVELARRHYFSAIDLGAQPSPEIESAFAVDSE